MGNTKKTTLELDELPKDIADGLVIEHRVIAVVRGSEDVGVLMPAERAEEALRAWGRRELGRILQENRALNADMTDDEIADLVNQEIEAYRGEKAAKRRTHG